MKQDGRSLDHDTLEAMRVVAVQRMREGEHPEAVAESFGMNRSWAYKCRALASGPGRGLRALRSTKSTGRPRKLTPSQERQIVRWVNHTLPRQHGLAHAHWSRPAVREMVLEHFEVDLSLSSISVLLARLGLSARGSLCRSSPQTRRSRHALEQDTFPANHLGR